MRPCLGTSPIERNDRLTSIRAIRSLATNVRSGSGRRARASRPRRRWPRSTSRVSSRFTSVVTSPHREPDGAVMNPVAALTWIADHRADCHSDRKAQTAVSALAELTPNGLGHFLRPMQRIAAEAAQRSILRPRSRKVAASRTSLGVAALRRRSAGSRFSRRA
jgi:hypothetical protein